MEEVKAEAAGAEVEDSGHQTPINPCRMFDIYNGGILLQLFEIIYSANHYSAMIRFVRALSYYNRACVCMYICMYICMLYYSS